MFIVMETGMNGRKNFLAKFPTYEAAWNYVENLGVYFMEGDVDYPGCADAYMADGSIVAIEPEGFKVDSNA